MSKRRNQDAAFKARVVLEAVEGERTVSELAAEYDVHPTMIHQWKRSLREGAAGIIERGARLLRRPWFPKKRSVICIPRSENWPSPTIFVTKAPALDLQARRGMVEKNHRSLSFEAPCRLLSISRSSFYYAPQGETALNLGLMLKIDKQFPDTPF